MQLDQITANIRMRNPWEAMDLGFALVRHSWQAIYLPWLMFLTTCSVICYMLMPEDYKQYAIFAVWWFKPLYDRFLLNILSHKLFNDNLSTTQALKATPRLIKSTGLFGGLTFRRPSFSRGFNLPIWQLEQLRGKARSSRQSILLRNAHSHAVGLTLGMIFIELTLYFSLYALIILFLPETFQGSAFGIFFGDDLSEGAATWLHILDQVIYTLALFLIEPFYVAASFTLYINRRTQLEAWDIELVFRQIAKRLKNTGRKLLSLIALSLIVFTMVAIGAPDTVYAESKPISKPVKNAANVSEGQVNVQDDKAQDKVQEEHLADHRLPADQSASVIATIIQRKELSNEKLNTRWVKIKKDKKKKKKKDSLWDLDWFFDPITAIVSILFESVLWIALVVAAIFLFITRKSWLPLLNRAQQDDSDYQAPEVMFGMDIRPKSLPDNIPEAARKLWQAHKHRDALSLLYRGALTQLVTKDQLALKASQTEGDILKLAKTSLGTTQHAYLNSLTEQWKQIAYAHHIPEEQRVTVLFDRWNADFTQADLTSSKQSGSAS